MSEGTVEGIDILFIFSRFCSFYHRSAEEVMAMPAYLFWAMESQITRLKAENDIRRVNVQQSTLTADAMTTTMERLSLELGETSKVKRSWVVKPEAGAREKMLSLTK